METISLFHLFGHLDHFYFVSFSVPIPHGPLRLHHVATQGKYGLVECVTECVALVCVFL